MKTFRVWLVRHAPVSANFLYGQMDVLADHSDQKTYDWISSQLPNSFALVSSDLTRCVETANHIIAHSNQSIQLTKETQYREQNFGEWQGLTYEEIRTDRHEESLSFWENPVENQPPGGESFRDVCERVTRRFQSQLESLVQDDLVIVSHAGPIRAIVANALELEPVKAQLIDIEPLSVSRLTVYQADETISWKIDWINRVRAR
ncbi:histidine phosphatase family protein [Sneathiella limimaris]|uniref:histidine phosphatase family protein n=1 Tax=Sneathiella limimaris TaxID=1964213 RepID=UPI00146A1ACA